jgi:hypothetical protein
MPITPVQEFLNGGIVTVRDATLLKPGELQQAEECVYRKFDPAIWSAPGRTTYNSGAISAAVPVSGLTFLNFPLTSTSHLFVWSGSTFYTSPFTALTGSFLPITGRGTITCNLTYTSTGDTAVPTLTATSNTAEFTHMAIGTKVLYNTTAVPIKPWAVVVSVAGDYKSVVISTGSVAVTATAIPVQFADFVTWTAPTAVPTSLDALDVVAWDNRYYLLCSTNAPVTCCFIPNRVYTPATSSALAIRYAGLQPVISWGTGVSESGPLRTTGVWSAALGLGTYWFVLTECIDPDGPNELESAYTANNGAARSVSITSLLQSVVFTFPLLRNTGRDNTNRATHFCIYMSDKQPDAETKQPPLSTFKRYALVPIAETATAGAPPLTPVYSNVQIEMRPSSLTSWATGTAGANPSFTYVDFESDSGFLHYDDSLTNYSRGSVQWADAQTTAVTISRVKLNYPLIADPGGTGFVVTGLKMKIGATSGPGGTTGSICGGFKAQIADSTGVDKTIEWSVQLQEGANLWKFYETGGQFDTMGMTATLGDLVTTGLQLYLTASYWKPGVLTYYSSFRECMINVYYTTSSTTQLQKDSSSSRFFRTVTYRSQIGTTICEPTNFPPPNATTGTVFNGQLVTNDVTDPTVIRYALAGYPEYFPKPYVLKFMAKDPVTCIKRVGQVLVVGMRNSIRRVNYLPTEADTDFQQGLAHEDLAVDHGIVGTHANTLFDLTGKGVILAYVSADGLYATDGITTRPLCKDLDWANTVNVANLNRCVLQEYPKEKWLVLYYNPKGAVHCYNTKALIFVYDQAHIKDEGTLSCIGPITVSGCCATTAVLNTETYLLTGHQTSGHVYIEDNGLTIPNPYVVVTATSTNDTIDETQILNCPKITTRLMYAAGLERTTRIERIYLRSSIYGATSTISGCTVTKDSIYVTKTGTTVFNSILPGMRVRGTNIKPGTIVMTVTAGTTTPTVVPAEITLSSAAIGTSTTTDELTFDTGTLTIMTSGEQVGDTSPALMGSQLPHPSAHAQGYSSVEKAYISTTNTSIPVAHADNISQGLQIHIERIRMPDDLSGEAGTGSWYVDLSVPMRLHYFDILVSEAGMETNRASN